MINDLLDTLALNIKRAIPELNKGIYLARIDEEGRVLRPKNPETNEFEYAGLSDTEGQYFYIRHRDGGEIAFEESPNSKNPISCGFVRYLTRYDLRIVLCLRRYCPYSAESKLRTAIIGTSVPNSLGRTSVKFIPRRSLIDSISVLKEESPKVKPFDKNLIFISFDFDIVFEVNLLT